MFFTDSHFSVRYGSRDDSVGIATALRAGRSGLRITEWARGFSVLQNVKTESGAHPASYSRRIGTLRWAKGSRSVTLPTYLHVVPRLGMSGARVPLWREQGKNLPHFHTQNRSVLFCVIARKSIYFRKCKFVVPCSRTNYCSLPYCRLNFSTSTVGHCVISVISENADRVWQYCDTVFSKQCKFMCECLWTYCDQSTQITDYNYAALHGDSFSVQLVAFLHPRVQIIFYLLSNVTSRSQSISVQNVTFFLVVVQTKGGGGNRTFFWWSL